MFRNYPQWPLQDWVVYRSWYKNLIDTFIRPNGTDVLKHYSDYPYSSWEYDPVYDPNAPDWNEIQIWNYCDSEIETEPYPAEVSEGESAEDCEADDVYGIDNNDKCHNDLEDDFEDDDYYHDDGYYYNDNFEYEDDEYFYYRKKKPLHLRRVDNKGACAYFGNSGFGISPPGAGGS